MQKGGADHSNGNIRPDSASGSIALSCDWENTTMAHPAEPEKTPPPPPEPEGAVTQPETPAQPSGGADPASRTETPHAEPEPEGSVTRP